MVGIVIVSHSWRIAEGVAELAREMGGDEVALETAGGLEPIAGPDGPEHAIGTDAVLVMQAIDRAWSDDGVLVLMDLGSAVLSAEMALDLLGDDRRDRILLCEAPLVEGAVAAAVSAKLGLPLEAVADEARGGLAGKASHLGADPTPGGPQDVAAAGHDGPAVTAVLAVDVPHGLHARPAARFVQTAAGFDATVTVRNRTTGAGPADATSLNGVATLGAAAGHDLEVAARGPEAAAVVTALEALAARRYDEPAEAADTSAATPSAVPDGSSAPVPASAREGSGGPGSVGADAGMLVGFAASPGIAIGPARRFHTPPLDVPDRAGADPASERRTLDRAVLASGDDIGRQRDAVATWAGEQEAAIFDAHRLFLRDEALLGPARAAIDEGASAAVAWRDAVAAVAASWDGLDDAYLRARAVDLRSVGAQVLARILGVPVPAPRLDAPGVLVAADLTPADTAGLDPGTALGIVTAHGGPTSHAAVLARALGIPAVVGVGAGAAEVAEGTALAVDGAAGEVHVDPDRALMARLESERIAIAEAVARAASRAGAPAATTDGITIEVAANVGRPDEVAAAVAAGADGIGLFRTEFLFMDRDAVPDEGQQEAAYRAAAEALGGRPLLVRTLDAGADKPVRALGLPPESNPFLGVRGIRLGLARPDLLRTQLRALLRVAADHRVRVMFPMVATVGELAAARAELERARSEVGASPPLEVGCMIEVPAAALTTAALARGADFFSIGTNDLTQYALAADRGNERVAELNDPLHPAVLRLIAATAEGAVAAGRWVGVCGELAGEPAATALLLGLGVTELSMAAPAIATVKDAVRALELTDARRLAARALGCASAAEVRELLASP